MNVHPSRLAPKTVLALRSFVLAAIFVAGLWPFHVLRNEVGWLEDANGLAFGRHGAVVSENAFADLHSVTGSGNSLEILLTPKRSEGEGGIVAFDSSPNPRAPFLVRQYGTSIAVQRYLVDERGNVIQPWLKVDHVLEAGRQVFVSITANRTHTRIYVDGILAGTALDMGIDDRDLTGRLVLAKSTVDDGWCGQIAGLAIYHRELTSGQVTDHFQRWMSGRHLELRGEELPVALYRFDERAGATVHSAVSSMNDLTIPDRYFVLHPAFLLPIWEQYSGTWNYWKSWSCWEDWVINIGGFVPVGFVFFASVNSGKATGNRALLVVLLGFCLSFAVEALQRFLPNRDSGMTDLFTNTAGTALGVVLHRFTSVREVWVRILHLGTRSEPLRQQQ